MGNVFDMFTGPNKSRCLVLGCSRAKNASPELMPAVQRYDGPPFKVLRRYLDENLDNGQRLDIFVLSAQYGLIEGQTAIANYDQRMTEKRAAELRKPLMMTIQQKVLPKDYDQIFLSMGKVYLQAVDGLENMVNGHTQIIISDSAAGKKLTELKNWLWDTELLPVKRKQTDLVTPKVTPQTAVLRGRTVTLTTIEAMEQLQMGIAQELDSARQVRSWYVDVNGEKISPKWAAQYLFNIPVSRFAADEARRVLRRLGLNCYKA